MAKHGQKYQILSNILQNGTKFTNRCKDYRRPKKPFFHRNPTSLFLVITVFNLFFQWEKGIRTLYYGQKEGNLWWVFWGVNKSLVNITSHIYFCNRIWLELLLALKGSYDNFWPNFSSIMLSKLSNQLFYLQSFAFYQ